MVKKLYRQTTFGEIAVYESLFLKEGILIRPFSESCDVKCGGYSCPPQRGITDSGADVSFNGIPEKLYEHHGITIPYSQIRNITEKHAEAVKADECRETEIPGRDGAGYILSAVLTVL